MRLTTLIGCKWYERHGLFIPLVGRAFDHSPISWDRSNFHRLCFDKIGDDYTLITVETMHDDADLQEMKISSPSRADLLASGIESFAIACIREYDMQGTYYHSQR